MAKKKKQIVWQVNPYRLQQMASELHYLSQIVIPLDENTELVLKNALRSQGIFAKREEIERSVICARCGRTNSLNERKCIHCGNCLRCQGEIT